MPSRALQIRVNNIAIPTGCSAAGIITQMMVMSGDRVYVEVDIIPGAMVYLAGVTPEDRERLKGAKIAFEDAGDNAPGYEATITLMAASKDKKKPAPKHTKGTTNSPVGMPQTRFW